MCPQLQADLQQLHDQLGGTVYGMRVRLSFRCKAAVDAVVSRIEVLTICTPPHIADGPCSRLRLPEYIVLN